MSLLQQDSTGLDDAARGEEYTKGTSHVVWAAVAATIVVSIAIAIYVIAGQKPPIAKGQIEAVWAHAQNITTKGTDANGAAMAQENLDEEMVFTHISLKNQSQNPIFLSGIMTNLTLDDGIHSSYAASKTDYDRMFIAYPSLTVPHGNGISPTDTEIDAGQTLDGTFVSAFKISKQQWDARKKLDYTVSFRYQPSLTIAPQVSITDQ